MNGNNVESSELRAVVLTDRPGIIITKSPASAERHETAAATPAPMKVRRTNENV